MTYPSAFCILNTSLFCAAASKIPCISCDGETSRTTTMHPSFRGNYSSVSLSIVAGIFRWDILAAPKQRKFREWETCLIKGNARNVAGFSRRCFHNSYTAILIFVSLRSTKRRQISYFLLEFANVSPWSTFSVLFTSWLLCGQSPGQRQRPLVDCFIKAQKIALNNDLTFPRY